MPPPPGGLAGAPRAAALRAATLGPAFPHFRGQLPQVTLRGLRKTEIPWRWDPGMVGVNRGTLRSSCASRGKRRSPAPSSLLPAELAISARFASAATGSAVRAVALQRRRGLKLPDPLREPHFGVSRSLLHIPLPSLFALPEQSWQCHHRGSYPPEPLGCVLAPVQVQGWRRAQRGGNLQDLVASALSADTLPSYWLSQRPQGGLQQASYRARLAHFTS